MEFVDRMMSFIEIKIKTSNKWYRIYPSEWECSVDEIILNERKMETYITKKWLYTFFFLLWLLHILLALSDVFHYWYCVICSLYDICIRYIFTTNKLLFCIMLAIGGWLSYKLFFFSIQLELSFVCLLCVFICSRSFRFITCFSSNLVTHCVCKTWKEDKGNTQPIRL